MSARPIRRKWAIESAKASSVSTWAMTARSIGERLVRNGDRAAEYGTWRALMKAVRMTTPIHENPPST